MLVLPSPSSYLGEPLLVDMVHHHNLIIKRSTRPSRAVERGSQLRYEVQVIYIYVNSYYSWRAIYSLLLTFGPKQLKVTQVETTALGQHFQQHPSHRAWTWRSLGPGATKGNFPQIQMSKLKSLESPELRGASVDLALKSELILSFLWIPISSILTIVAPFCSSPAKKKPKPNQTPWWTQ